MQFDKTIDIWEEDIIFLKKGYYFCKIADKNEIKINNNFGILFYIVFPSICLDQDSNSKKPACDI